MYQIVRFEAAIPTLILVLSEPTTNSQRRIQIYTHKELPLVAYSAAVQSTILDRY